MYNGPSDPDFSKRAASAVLLVLLVARLALGVAYSVLNPLGEAPDEADHYAYAAYIEREGRLPVGPEMTQAKHPPLYHLLAAGLARSLGVDMEFGFLRSNPDVGVGPGVAAPNFFIHTSLEEWPLRDLFDRQVQDLSLEGELAREGSLAMHLGRFVSVIAGVLLTLATYALGRVIWPRWRSGPLAAAAFVAFLPETLFVGGAMSNDMLAALWSTLALWLGLRVGALASPRAGLGMAALAGVAMGLAFLTKASTAGLWPVVGLAILLQGLQADAAPLGDLTLPSQGGRPSSYGSSFRSSRGSLWAAAGRAIAACAIALLIAAPWLWRNWRLYGDPLGRPLVLATIDRRQGSLAAADLLRLAKGWFLSFWGKFGGAGHLVLPVPFYLAWIVLFLSALVGWLVLLRREGKDLFRDTSPAGWAVLLGASAMTILSILSYSSVALGTDQGRLLFPALASVALLLVRGMAAWLPPQRGAWLAAGMAGGMALVAVLALEIGIVRPFAPPLAPAQAEIAEATSLGEVFGNELELAALRWAELPPEEARGVDTSLTLYWRARRPVADDLRTTVRLTDSAGNLAWEWKRSPGAGRFSTDRWPVNRLVSDVYEIPAEALARATRVEVGVRPFPERDWLPLANHPGLQLLSLPVEPSRQGETSP